jgi:Fe2+ or Zn2+ uptake regulation protein
MHAFSVDQIIFGTLSKEHARLTSLQIFEEIHLRLPKVNQTAVYRTLERLVNCSKVSVSDMGNSSTVFELLADGLHHHLICHNCGQVMTMGHGEYRYFFCDHFTKKITFISLPTI